MKYGYVVWWLVIVLYCTPAGMHVIPMPSFQDCQKTEIAWLEFAKTEEIYGYGTTCWREDQSTVQIEALCQPQDW